LILSTKVGRYLMTMEKCDSWTGAGWKPLVLDCMLLLCCNAHRNGIGKNTVPLKRPQCSSSRFPFAVQITSWLSTAALMTSVLRQSLLTYSVVQAVITTWTRTTSCSTFLSNLLVQTVQLGWRREV